MITLFRKRVCWNKISLQPLRFCIAVWVCFSVFFNSTHIHISAIRGNTSINLTKGATKLKKVVELNFKVTENVETNARLYLNPLSFSTNVSSKNLLKAIV